MAQPKIDAHQAYWQADGLLLGNNFKQAVVLYSRSIKAGGSLSSKLGSKYYRLGSSFYCQQKYEKAMMRYQRAAKLDSSFYQAYNGIGLCHLNLGRIEEAIRLFKKSLMLSKDYDLPYINWALALLLRGKKHEALDVFEKIRTQYENAEKRNKTLEIYKEEIVFAKERIASSNDSNVIKSAEEMIRVVQYIIDLIQKACFEEA